MWAKIGIYLASEDPYKGYFVEALEHGGLSFSLLDSLSSDDVRALDVLLLAGYGKLNDTQESTIAEWVDRGGALVCCGSSWGLHSVLGLGEATLHASNAVASFSSEDRLWPTQAPNIRFFGGRLNRPGQSQTICQTNDGWVILSRNMQSRGLAIFMAPHVGQTMAQMQMGRSVEIDGIGPTDGSAVLDDGYLRSEDGTTLSFELDRARVGNDGAPFFAYPHADAIREMLLRAMMNAIEHTGLSTAVLWPWPDLAPAAMSLTIDCEDLNPSHVNRMYQLLSMHGCPAAWLVPQPGYPLDVYRSMRAWEHEIGCLFAVDNNGGWTSEHLKLQRTALSRAASVSTAYTCRPQNGQWRGWDAFYDMCEVGGVRVSIAKGGRQPGTSGFLFGTSHPFFSYRRDGAERLVLELPYTVYQPGAVTSDAACDAIFAQTIQRNGCFHVVCHPEASADATISNSVRRLITNSRSSKVVMMLPEQIYQFEKGRRSMRRVMSTSDDGGQMLLISEVPMEGLSVLISGPQVSVEMKGHLSQARVVEKYGAKFTAFQLNIDQKQHVEVRLHQLTKSKVA